MAGVQAQEGRAIFVRIAAPAVALFVVVVILGLLLTPPGIAIPTGEGAISAALEASRTDTWNTITLAWSLLGSQGGIIGVGVIVAALILARTGDRQLAAVPVLASILHQAIFLLAANIVDRSRPSVDHLDEAPPTASYPSGHVGSATALYLTFALLAPRIRIAWLRWLTVAVCLSVPPLVAFGRLYRGMHHPTDVAVAFVNGITCALLAYWWYRAGRAQSPSARAVSDHSLGNERTTSPT